VAIIIYFRTDYYYKKLTQKCVKINYKLYACNIMYCIKNNQLININEPELQCNMEPSNMFVIKIFRNYIFYRDGQNYSLRHISFAHGEPSNTTVLLSDIDINIVLPDIIDIDWLCDDLVTLLVMTTDYYLINYNFTKTKKYFIGSSQNISRPILSVHTGDVAYIDKTSHDSYCDTIDLAIENNNQSNNIYTCDLHHNFVKVQTINRVIKKCYKICE
jgi:hypothetical protein